MPCVCEKCGLEIECPECDKTDDKYVPKQKKLKGSCNTRGQN